MTTYGNSLPPCNKVAYLDFIKAVFISTLRVNNVVVNSKLIIYPNRNEAGVFNLSRTQKWEVYAISGIKIKEGEGMHINLSQFAKGVYLLKTDMKSFKLLKH